MAELATLKAAHVAAARKHFVAHCAERQGGSPWMPSQATREADAELEQIEGEMVAHGLTAPEIDAVRAESWGQVAVNAAATGRCRDPIGAEDMRRQLRAMGLTPVGEAADASADDAGKLLRAMAVTPHDDRSTRARAPTASENGRDDDRESMRRELRAAGITPAR